MDGLCQYLEWDSRFFGQRIARITVNRLTQENIRPILAWCESNSIDCLYFLGDLDDGITVQVAEGHQFHFVDSRVTLVRDLERQSIGDGRAIHAEIRPSTSSDIPRLRSIARISHRDSRFYFDPNFPASRCDALYETWIENSCNGYADVVWVACSENQPVGYVSCHRQADSVGQIGLIGIDPLARGNGLGQALVNAALRWFAERDIRHVSVVTQGRNTAAQRMYQRCGFLTRSTQLWYHRWFQVKDMKDN